MTALEQDDIFRYATSKDHRQWLRCLALSHAQGEIDIHAETVARALNVLVGAVTAEQRSYAKRVNFYLLYT